jgi:predicted O-methyltransferase YrrM
VRRVLERVSRERRVTAEDGSSRDLDPVAIPPREGEALRAWVARERARQTLEVGLGFAVSTLYICEALLAANRDGVRHVAIDLQQTSRFADAGLRLLEDAGVGGLVEHLAEDSQLALPRLLRDGERFDLAFVDGDHRFDALFVDLFFVGRLLRPGGIVFVDDHQLPAIARAVSFFVGNLEWVVEELSPGDPHHQWIVLRTSASPDTRPFDFFVDF